LFTAISGIDLNYEVYSAYILKDVSENQQFCLGLREAACSALRVRKPPFELLILLQLPVSFRRPSGACVARLDLPQSDFASRHSRCGGRGGGYRQLPDSVLADTIYSAYFLDLPRTTFDRMLTAQSQLSCSHLPKSPDNVS
jgi:hypothetical protein